LVEKGSLQPSYFKPTAKSTCRLDELNNLLKKIEEGGDAAAALLILMLTVAMLFYKKAVN
jgi:hypothetical protein